MIVMDNLTDLELFKDTNTGNLLLTYFCSKLYATVEVYIEDQTQSASGICNTALTILIHNTAYNIYEEFSLLIGTPSCEDLAKLSMRDIIVAEYAKDQLRIKTELHLQLH